MMASKNKKKKQYMTGPLVVRWLPTGRILTAILPFEKRKTFWDFQVVTKEYRDMFGSLDF